MYRCTTNEQRFSTWNVTRAPTCSSKRRVGALLNRNTASCSSITRPARALSIAPELPTTAHVPNLPPPPLRHSATPSPRVSWIVLATS